MFIIENLEWNSMLHCRAYRLVGNLSECSWHAEELCNAGVMKPLVALLTSKTDVQNYCMAVRAVRYKIVLDSINVICLLLNCIYPIINFMHFMLQFRSNYILIIFAGISGMFTETLGRGW